MSFPRYPKYKPSGVEWLGEVPEHWDVLRFKSVISERFERSDTGLETLLSVSMDSGVVPRTSLLDEGEQISRAESLDGYKICWKGDLVVNIMLAWNRGLGVTAYDGIVSPAYSVFEVVGPCDWWFLNYLVRSNEYIGYFKAFSAGVVDSRLRIYPDVLRARSVVLPPLVEQQAIVLFLNERLAECDALLGEQQRLLELLKEKRQAIISHAVTKGLNQDAPMKMSGVDFVRQVPAHWRVVRSDAVVRTARETLDPRELAPHEVCHYSIPAVQELGSGHIEEGRGIDSAKTIIREPQVLVSRLNPRKGTICVAVPAQQLTVCSTEFVPLIPSGCNIGYLFYCVQSVSYRARLESRVESVTRSHQRVGVAEVAKFRWAFPPEAEQIAIAAWLAHELSALDALRETVENGLRLLDERRSALISAAVTGQIDVRNLVPSEVA